MKLSDLTPQQKTDFERSIVAAVVAAEERYGLRLAAACVFVDMGGQCATLVSNVTSPALRQEILRDAANRTGQNPLEYLQ